MTVQSIHRVLGLVMIIPLVLWALTGFIFLTKPGYEGAYEKIAPLQYEISHSFEIPSNQGWQHIQLSRTILGLHLIVNDRGNWKHFNPETLLERPFPTKQDFKRLINDAISLNKERYGDIVEVKDNLIVTSTGVEISMDWSRMTLRQRGDDTRLISALYKIHYLQWFDSEVIDQVISYLGLLLLVSLTGFGVFAYFKKRKPSDDKASFQ